MIDIESALKEAENGKQIIDEHTKADAGNQIFLIFPDEDEQLLLSAYKYLDRLMSESDHTTIISSIKLDDISRYTNRSYEIVQISEEEMKRFMGIFACGDYEDMWNKLFLMYDYFEELSIYVAEKLGFPLDLEESHNVRDFMVKRRAVFDMEKDI